MDVSEYPADDLGLSRLRQKLATVGERYPDLSVFADAPYLLSLWPDEIEALQRLLNSKELSA